MNWGHKIIIVFTLFAAGILTLVTKSMRTTIDMVNKDYYAEELQYQQVINGQQNAGKLSAPVQITQSATAVVMQLPPELHGRTLQGQVLFYRPSDSGKDITLPLQPDPQGMQQVAIDQFIRGGYRVKVKWEMDGQPYYQEQYLHIQ